MSKNTSEAPKETQKGRHGKSMIVLQIDTNSPLLFMDMPEDNLATGHPLTEEWLGKEGGVEKKHKKKKHRRHVIEGAEVMLETAKVEMAEQEQERELGAEREQGEEQARDRKKKKKEKKQHKQKPEDCGVSSEVNGTKEKKNTGEMGQGKEANELETFEQEEHVSQKRRKRTKTRCDPAELRAQCETIAGADDGASKLVERISEQTPREILQERKKKKKKREKNSDRTELTVQGETEDGTEVSQQEEEIPRRKNRKKVEHCSDQAESGVQAEIEDGTESSQQEENILVQTPQEVLQAPKKKKKKRKDANNDQTESNIQGRVEDGTESSQQEENVLVQTPQEVLQATKKKKKRKDANSDQTELNIQGRVEDGTESEQHEEIFQNNVLQETKKKKKKRKEANTEKIESNIPGEVEDGTGTSQHEEETPNEVLQLTKKKKKKRKEANTDKMESNIQGEVEDGTGTSQHEEETPNEVLQETKKKKKKRKEANTDEMESNIQGRIEDGTESEQHEEIIQNNVLHETKKKRQKREEANTDKMESNIQGEVEDGTGTSQHEEETPNEVLQETKKKKKKRKEANTDEMESNIQGRIEDGTESEQHEEIIQNNVLHETKKKRQKREEANTDEMESNIQGEVEDGTGTLQHVEETPNEVLQATKKKKKTRRETTSDHQTASNIQGEIEDYSETSKPREEITEQIPQGILREETKKRRKSNCRQIELSVQSEIENDGEIPLVENRKKRRINNKSDQTESSVQVETMAGVKECAKASRQRGTSKQIPPESTRTRKNKGEGSSGKKRQEILAEVKNSENQAVVFTEEPTEHSLEIEKWGDHWEEEKMKYMDELKEFIPGVEKKSTHSVYHLVKYDLLRFREFKKAGVGLKRGRYTVDELARLKKNVEDFLALTGIDSCTKLFFPSRFPDEKAEITKLKSQYKFHLRLSDGICRPWHDIYNKGRKLFDTCRIGRFTDDEINSLLKLQQLHGNKWTKISELTNRSSAALEKRYAQLCKNKGTWSEHELQLLEKAVRDHVVTLAEARDDGPMVRRDQLYSNLPWTEVAQKVGTRSWVQCRSKWMYVLNKRMSAGIEDQHGYDTLQNRIRFIRQLYAQGIDDVADINWEDLTKMFGDVTPHFVQTRFHRLKAKWVPRWHALSFGEIVDFLYEKALPQLEKLQEPERGTGGRSTQQESFLLSEIFGEV